MSESLLYCPNCGGRVQRSAPVCPHCGADFGVGSAWSLSEVPVEPRVQPSPVAGCATMFAWFVVLPFAVAAAVIIYLFGWDP